MGAGDSGSLGYRYPETSHSHSHYRNSDQGNHGGDHDSQVSYGLGGDDISNYGIIGVSPCDKIGGVRSQEPATFPLIIMEFIVVVIKLVTMEGVYFGIKIPAILFPKWCSNCCWLW